VVSELVTNAIRHTFGAVQLGLADVDGDVLVEVFDESLRVPSVVDAGDDATSGRGLAIVAALSRGWGAEELARDGRVGKVVWARCRG